MRRLLMLVVIAALASPTVHAEVSPEKRRYELAAGDAATTLRRFAEQSGEQILFVVPQVRGVRTQAVQGEFTAREAIDRMLVGTVLVVVEDTESGALMISRATQMDREPTSSEAAQPTKPPTQEKPKSMKRKSPFSILVAAATMLFAPADAQETAAEAGSQVTAYREAGVIVGTVSNESTRQYLKLARVRVQETGREVLTDESGRFRISGLEPGTYTLVSTYTGLEAMTTQVTLTAEAGVRIELMLTSDEYYVLGEFTVTGTVEGNAFAVNKQRQSESARTVTSVDAFVDQTTGNPGEFLKNLEGIQMNYSQNEPQTIALRGFDANLTTLTMDGNPIASSASTSTNRAVQVDQLSIASIDSVEVFKAPIPSMSANAIGGAVNFITKSAFDVQGRRAFLQLGVNTDSHDFMSFSDTPSPGHGDDAEGRVYPIGRFEYRNTFLDNRLGVMFSLARDHTNQLGSSASHALDVAALPGGTLPAAPELYTEENTVVRRGSFSIAPNRQLRTRDDISLNLDYKLTEEIALFLRTSLSDYHSTNRNHGFTLAPGTRSADSTLETQTITGGTASQSVSVFDKYTHSWQINPGLKFVSGDWRVDLIGGFSKSTNHYNNASDFGGLSIRLQGISYTMSTPRHTEVPDYVTQLNVTPTTDYFILNNYAPNQGNLASTGGQHRANHGGIVNSNFRNSADVLYTGRLDVRRDFQARFPFYIKGGLGYSEQYRDKHQPQKRWYWMGEDGVATPDDLTAAGAQLGRFKESVPVTVGIPGFGLQEPEYFDTHAFWEYWQDNPQVLQENLAYSEQQKFAGRQKVHETIMSAYLMGSVTFDRLNVLAGVRLEKTEDEATSYRVLPTSGGGPDQVTLPPGVDANSLSGIQATHRWATSKDEYTSDPFKYLHLKYEITRNLQARAAYTEAIGRPNFGDIVPTMTQSDSDVTLDGVLYDGRITSNGADLGPQRSKGFDVNLEYYTESSGMFTMSWYSRDVDDYIQTSDALITDEQLTELNLGPEYSNYLLRRTRNVGNAKWNGIELGFRQQLRGFKSLPRVLQGFEFWANYTKNLSMEGDFGSLGTNIHTLQNVVPEMYNGGVSYLSPKGKFYVGLKTNYQDRRPQDSLPAFNANGQRDRWQEEYQFWDLDVKYKLNQRVSFSCTGRNLFGERPTISQIGGIIINTQQDTGIAWTFATRIEL